MRIRTIHIDGFGLLRDRHFELEGSLSVFYGPNEAGKSTLMGFIRAVLFGFPSRQSRAAERYEPPHGGVHGGWLIMEDAQGQLWRVARYDAPGRGRSASGIVTVTPLAAAGADADSARVNGAESALTSASAAGGEALLHTLLGGIGPDLFRSLFAFGLSELQELGTLQSEEISGYLYNAGWGASGKTIMTAERKLAQEMERLYKPKGQNQEIHLAAKALDIVETDIRRSKEEIGKYNEALESFSEIETNLHTIENELAAVRHDLTWLGIARQTRPHWHRWLELERELALLPNFPTFPHLGVHRLDTWKSEQDQLFSEQDKLERKKEQLVQAIEALRVEPSVLQHATELEGLLEQIPIYENNRLTEAAMQTELRLKEQEIAALLMQIDDQWTLDELSQFPISVAEREQVRHYRERAESLRMEMDRSQIEVARIEEQMAYLQKKRNVQEDEWKALLQERDVLQQAIGPIDAHGVPGYIQQINQDFERWQHTKRELQHIEQRIADWQAQTAWMQQTEQEKDKTLQALQRKRLIMSLVGLLVIPSSLIAFKQWEMAAVVGLLLLITACYFFWGSSGERRVSRMRSRPEEPMGELQRQKDAWEREAMQWEQHMRHTYSQWTANRGLTAAASEWMDSQPHGSTNGEFVPFAQLDDAGHVNKQTDVYALVGGMLQQLKQVEAAWHSLQPSIQQAELRYLESEQEWQTLEGLLQHARNQTEDAAGKFRVWQLEWYERLHSRKLNPNLSTDAVMEIIQFAEQGKALVQHKQLLEGKLQTIHDQISGFSKEVKRLLALQQEDDPVVELKRWQQLAQQQATLVEQKEQLTLALEQISEEHDMLQDKFERVTAHIDALLAEGFAEDEEQFRIHAAQVERKEQLHREQQELSVIFDTVVGSEKCEVLFALLQSNGPIELEQQFEDKQMELNQRETQIAELREQKGRLTHELDKLESGAGHAEQLQRLEEAKTVLKEHVKQWVTVSLCNQLFRKAKDVYERERQPEVLRRASDHFAQMTAGQYIRIIAPIGEKRLLAQRKDGDVVEVGLLSRGTAEQLYLAMRFALADEYAHKVSLPIVMDDILVNFDRARVQHTLALIRSMMERHQLLLFTCHDFLVDVITESIPERQLLSLPRVV